MVMDNLKTDCNLAIFTILFTSLIFSSIPTDFAFADDDSEEHEMEKEREQEKKEQERSKEEQKKVSEQDREDRKKIEERIKESLKFDDDIIKSGNIGDWVLVGTVVLILGVIGNTGYKIIKPKKRKTSPAK